MSNRKKTVTKRVNRDITIKDVAERAGVAVSTVSRVLNNLDRVSDETREKVKKAADELGFVRNTLAASVKTGRSNMIMVVVPDIINEYYTAVIQGVEEVAVKCGYFTLVFASNDTVDKENEFFNGKFGKIVDGVIMIPAHEDLSFIKTFGRPVVIVDRYVPGSHNEAVIIDNFRGAYLLTRELLKNGHKDIGVLMGPKAFNIGQERMGGFEQAMQDAGIPVQPQYIKYCTWYAESGYEKTNELLDMPNPPTAIYASNNLLGVGCIEALEKRGMQLGEDMSLVCFDDTLLAQYIGPGVTVIRRATVEMGRLAAQKLIDRMEGRETANTARKIILPVSLIQRGSVKNLNAPVSPDAQPTDKIIKPTEELL